jgi:hypothetical protein
MFGVSRPMDVDVLNACATERHYSHVELLRRDRDFTGIPLGKIVQPLPGVSSNSSFGAPRWTARIFQRISGAQMGER